MRLRSAGSGEPSLVVCPSCQRRRGSIRTSTPHNKNVALSDGNPWWRHLRSEVQHAAHSSSSTTSELVETRVSGPLCSRQHSRVAMKIAYLDCFSGVAGDMLLAALLDAVSLLERCTFYVRPRCLLALPCCQSSTAQASTLNLIMLNCWRSLVSASNAPTSTVTSGFCPA